jgi:hypothetical protein
METTCKDKGSCSDNKVSLSGSPWDTNR